MKRGQRLGQNSGKGGIEFQEKDMRQNKLVFFQYAYSTAENIYVKQGFLFDKRHLLRQRISNLP